MNAGIPAMGEQAMPHFLWKAKTRQGTVKKGEMEAANNEAVLAQLRAQMLQPVTVKKKAKDLAEVFPFLKPGITTKELVIFTRQFATMIDAGLPLVQCLEILGDQQENITFREVIREVRSDVEQGSTFADALRKHPKPFDALYVNLVQAGEIGGILDTILNRLAVYLEKADALARKVKGAIRDRSRRRHPGRRSDAGEDHSDVREDVRGLRWRAACADEDGHCHQ
jgi:type IV pilus assembly protein PilC